MKKNVHGYSMIELMVAITIISILTGMALPSLQDRIIRTQVKEALSLAEIGQTAISDYYKRFGKLPPDNKVAGLPLADKIEGNFVTMVKIADGVVDVTLGNKVNKHVEGKVLSIRPAIVPDSPIVPIAWVCGFASVPGKMTVMGKNKSDILPRHVPIECRY